ncbi:MAG: hypothetical protein DRQ47_00145 [Gammaproteobacteria bacterium]|nr:MAG: hypothetical protein DRQ47_00145 [Gammaproteobacteria bacterium]
MSLKWMQQLLLLFLASFISHAAVAGEKLVDPTKPPPFARTKSSKKIVTNFKLTEIRITKTDRQAVINGKRLSKGNKIGSYGVRKIEVGYVILANEKRTLRLNLIGSRIIRKEK